MELKDKKRGFGKVLTDILKQSRSKKRKNLLLSKAKIKHVESKKSIKKTAKEIQKRKVRMVKISNLKYF